MLSDVSLQHVSKHFGDVVAVADASLDIRRGEFLALLGPSGCGKTTLLNLVAGFLDPEQGEIFIRGRPMVGVKPFRRDVGMVFQNYALFPHMTVRQNVTFGLRMRRLGRRDCQERTDEALSLVKLDDFGDRFPNQLSGGQQQRVALARVIAVRPSVLLLDEPLAALDRQLREEMQVELRSLQKRIGITAICVTHDQEEALTMADRIAVLHRGRIEQVGTPAEIYERPINDFVAGFVGLSNTFDGVIQGTGAQGALIRTPEGDIVANSSAIAGKQVRLVVRPERMRLHRVPEPSANCIQVQVQDILYLGAHIRCFAVAASGKRIVVHQQNTMRGEGILSVSCGESAFVAWHPTDAVVLAESG